MITVTKSVYHFADGSKMIIKEGFTVAGAEELEIRRHEDRETYGCDRVNYLYYEEE